MNHCFNLRDLVDRYRRDPEMRDLIFKIGLMNKYASVANFCHHYYSFGELIQTDSQYVPVILERSIEQVETEENEKIKISGINGIKSFKQQSRRLDLEAIQNSQPIYDKVENHISYWFNQVTSYVQGVFFVIFSCYFCCKRCKVDYDIAKDFYERTKRKKVQEEREVEVSQIDIYWLPGDNYNIRNFCGYIKNLKNPEIKASKYISIVIQTLWEEN